MANQDWTAGYVSDLGYTHGFYGELTPQRLTYCALNAGQLSFNPAGTFRFCELGCGQGFSANLLASANPHGEFVATDFNPSQVAGARRLADEAGLSNIRFYDTPFASFVDEPSLPAEFDVIALHGIYSWISSQNRAAIVDFIARKLRVGGLVYISYNALPGYSAAAPLRHLMYLHGKSQGGPTMGRLEAALGFTERMLGCNAAFFRANPGLKERFDQIKHRDRAYLAHEYFNDHWELFYHSDVARDLASAKLTFAVSAALLETVDIINLTAEQSAILAEITDPVQRETAKDFMLNQNFRRDIFVKGPLPQSQRILQQHWMEQRFALSTPRADVASVVRGALGQANLQADVYDPLLDGLMHGPRTLGQLMEADAVMELGWARLMQALTILVGLGHLQPCLPLEGEEARAQSTRAFNRAVMERARDSGDLAFLASPVTGGGVQVDRMVQLFLLALENGRQDPAGWADFAADIILLQGQRLLKDGKPIEDLDANRAELLTRARAFAEALLPLLRQLKVSRTEGTAVAI